MSTLGFPSYSSSAAAAVAASRKFHEGNGMTSTATYLQPNDTTCSASSSSTTAYPYFTTPGADLYSVGSAAAAAAALPYASNNGSVNSSATGVFSSRTLQPTRPRSKSRANAGKMQSKY